VLDAKVVAVTQPIPSSRKWLQIKSLRRHSFLWFDDAAALFKGVANEVSEDELAILRDWVGRGLPLIVRRPCLSEDKSSVFAGLALPPTPSKRRLAFCLPVSFLSKFSEPPFWQDCLSPTSPDINAIVEPIQHAATVSELSLQAFGSYAWQHHTGLPYVTEQSDVDLLVPIDSKLRWRTFQRSMEGVSQSFPKIDLEIVINRNASFNWWEFNATGKRMLFKGNSSVWIGDKNTVEGLLCIAD
jgi:phosphoribosyl-dephospho-CoA transferase